MKLPRHTRHLMRKHPEIRDRWRARLFVADLWFNCTDEELAAFLFSEAQDVITHRRALMRDAEDLEIQPPAKYPSDKYIRALTVWGHYNKPPMCIIRMMIARLTMTKARLASVRDLLPYCAPEVIARFVHVDLPTIQLDIELLTVSWRPPWELRDAINKSLAA